MAYNAIDIAKKIVCRTDVEHGDTISNLKLQKLLYYMQGFHLAWFGTPFFNEPIEAWTYGPVVPVVFQEFKKYSGRAINPANYTDSLVLPDERQLLFDMVYKEYSRFSAVALMNMTHSDGPWKNHKMGERMTSDEIRDFFQSLIDENESEDGGESKALAQKTAEDIYAAGRDVTPDELYELIAKDIDAIYADESI